jgi:hypothetical protein
MAAMIHQSEQEARYEYFDTGVGTDKYPGGVVPQGFKEVAQVIRPYIDEKLSMMAYSNICECNEEIEADSAQNLHILLLVVFQRARIVCE